MSSAGEGTLEEDETWDSVEPRGILDDTPDASARLAELFETEAQDDAHDRSGTVFDGQFELIECIGQGGMGEVYLAKDIQLGRKVALKMLHPTKGQEHAWEERLRQFRRDATATARLQHPNIVTLHHIGFDQAQPYMVLEYLHGLSLQERLEQGTLEVPEALRIMEHVLEALAHAHDLDVVHRDLKPGNVFLRHDGVVKVLDFGVALLQASGEELRDAFKRDADELAEYLGASARSAGTPLYMAPEQLLGDAQDGRVDLWACGVMLFRMLTGFTPFETAFKALVTDPIPLSEARPDAPEELAQLVERCLQRDPQARFGAAREVLDEVRRLLDGPRALRRKLVGPGQPEGNLTDEPDAFVGRASELSALLEHWVQGDRMLTLVGPGGTGKTRLARRFARANAERFPGGVWFVDASEARDALGLVRTVADALEIPLKDDAAEGQLAASLFHRGKVLVVVDNLEQVQDQARVLLTAWLEATREATFLATSRVRLGVPREAVLALEPMPLPSPEATEAEVARNDAVGLFVERARAARPGFGLTATNAGAIAELVRTLDGLPLAIELAAARSRMMSPDKLLERLSRRFELLRDRKAARGSRHGALRETIAWSWELLEPHARAVFAQLAVFEGGFTLEAAEAVVDAAALEEDAAEVFEVLEDLVEHHLVRELPEDRGEPRFGMYVSLHAFAAEKLSDPEAIAGVTGEALERACRERHLEHFARLGSFDVLDAVHVRDRMEIVRLRQERDNLLAAHAFASARGPLEHAVPVAAALGQVHEADGLYQQGLRLLEQIAPLAQADEGAQARLDHVRTFLLWRRGQIDEAYACICRCQEVATARGVGALEARAWLYRGVLESERGDAEGARGSYDRALRLAMELGARRLEGVCRTYLAILDQHQGKLEEAKRGFEQALSIQREVGELRQEGSILGNLGVLHFTQGNLSDSESALQSALSRSREIGDQRTEGVLLSNLSVLAKHRGQTESARSMLESSLRLVRKLGDRRSEGIALGNLATIQREMGDHDEARRGLERAYTISEQLHDSRWQGYWLRELGELTTAQGAYREALEYLETAAGLFEGISDEERAARTWCQVGHALLNLGEIDGARGEYARAQEVAIRLGVTPESELGGAVEALRAAIEDAYTD
jgi:non-specific serine/threonine protein kinase